MSCADETDQRKSRLISTYFDNRRSGVLSAGMFRYTTPFRSVVVWDCSPEEQTADERPPRIPLLAFSVSVASRTTMWLSTAVMLPAQDACKRLSNVFLSETVLRRG